MSNKKIRKHNTTEQLAEELAKVLAETLPDEKEKVDKKTIEEMLEQELAAEETIQPEETAAATEEPVASEELANTETPVSEEEPAAEEPSVTEEEPTAEEPSVTEEEPAPEETPVVAEEPKAEETPTSEDVAETEVVPEAPQKKSSAKWVVLIILGAILLLAAAGYLATSKYFSKRFVFGTNVNGVDCSRKTLDEVEEVLQKQVEEYVITISGAGGTSEEIKGVDIDVTYVGYNQIKEAFAQQNAYLWPKSLINETKIDAAVVFEYNKEKLDTMISQLACVQTENQVAPESATVVYQDGSFVIKEEVYGTQIDMTKLSEAIHGSVSAMSTSVNLEETGCYVRPLFTKDSAEVIAAQDEMNKYLAADITYQLESVEVKLSKDTFASWISVGADMVPVISTDGAKEFTKKLSSAYNTADRGGTLITPTGEEVAISKAGYGRTVGTDQEVAQIVKEIKAGKVVVREPIFSRQATPEGQNLWGATYAEVDLDMQHMWFIQDGTVTFECDIVTGVANSSLATPAGTYTILEKKEDKILRGNIMPNGRREYETPVDYWARITWSGIGFHDATWQAAFGGERYKQGYGSHGCINMPLDAAATFYSMVYVGCPVIIHN